MPIKYDGLCSQCGGHKSYHDLKPKGGYYKRCYKCRLKLKNKKKKGK